MDRAEALRYIQHDLLEYIQKKVKVDFDNARQIPVSFTFGEYLHGMLPMRITGFKKQNNRLSR
jgi:hypothetical protein